MVSKLDARIAIENRRKVTLHHARARLGKPQAVVMRSHVEEAAGCVRK